MSRPFFSIVLPTFNRAHLLPRAIQSVQNQDFQDWEMIVVDDGSSDATAQVLQKIIAEDPRIIPLFNPHQGLSKTRNSGIHLAQAPFVTFIDSDDEYLPGHLSQHANYLRENQEIDMVHGKVTVVGDPYVPDARDTTKVIHVSECTQPGTFFIKKTTLESCGGFPTKEFGEDSALLELMEKKGFRLALSPYQTYRYYNTEPDSMCNQLKRKMKDDSRG